MRAGNPNLCAMLESLHWMPCVNLNSGREHLAKALRCAFPLPKSGCFDDLLQSIDRAEPRQDKLGVR